MGRTETVPMPAFQSHLAAVVCLHADDAVRREFLGVEGKEGLPVILEEILHRLSLPVVLLVLPESEASGHHYVPVELHEVAVYHKRRHEKIPSKCAYGILDASLLPTGPWICEGSGEAVVQPEPREPGRRLHNVADPPPYPGGVVEDYPVRYAPYEEEYRLERQTYAFAVLTGHRHHDLPVAVGEGEYEALVSPEVAPLHKVGLPKVRLRLPWIPVQHRCARSVYIPP